MADEQAKATPAKVKTLEEIDREIKEMQREEMLLRLDDTRENVAQTKARKEVRSRQNRQRQGQLRTDLLDRKSVIMDCTHRQGGSPGKERKGKGPSALRQVILPDNRELVMCANCGLRVFSPFVQNGFDGVYKNETKKAAKERLEQYQMDTAEFNRLKELAEDQLTPEAASPMHCGKQFEFKTSRGVNVPMPAPCDTYAQGRDNRNVA